MARFQRQIAKKQFKRKNFRRQRRSPKYNNRLKMSISIQPSFLSYIRFARTALSMLPMPNTPKLLKLFDFAFDLIAKSIDSKSYYTGAYSMFGVSPAALLVNSPMLAKDGSLYTFPGFPVSIKSLNFKIRNTTKLSEHSGRWAAVFIPYREVHDSDHYAKVIKDLTFQELCSMPHAHTGSADRDICIQYRMIDKTDYCSRPRELDEEIGLVVVMWDTTARDSSLINQVLTNVDFNCEVEMGGGCRPHVIFGPQHRNVFKPDIFKLRCLTNGSKIRIQSADGSMVHTDFSEFLRTQVPPPDFEMM